MKTVLLIVTLLLSGLALKAQTTDTLKQQMNNVLIFKDPRIDYLQKVYSGKYRVKQEAKRIYRVQLSATKSRTDINDLKTQFSSKYPGIPVFISFDPPTFKLRAGNFVSRQDAQQFLNEVRNQFPASFIVEQ
jgi:SPOR domain